MAPVPVTLATSAAAVLVNFWLGARIAAFRRDFKVGVGDGGHDSLLRRMRAQANFIEHAPFFLILLMGLELSGGDRLALGIIALIFIIARIAHGIGMDGGKLHRWRRDGMITSSIASVVLAVWALVRAVEFCLRG
ncbi:MAG TPA: MAPEG family protein [Sphingomicrobium sp.]